MVVQNHRPAALQRGITTLCVVQEAWWAPGLVFTYVVDRKSFASTGARIPGDPARSGALYGLRYSGPATVHAKRHVLCSGTVVTLLLVGCWSEGD